MKVQNNEPDSALETSGVALFVTGAPATGKSTLVATLGNMLGVPTIHVGKILREIADTGKNPVLRETVRELLSTGSPLPFPLYCEILGSAVKAHQHPSVIVDGSPRSLEQCHRLPEILEILNRPTASIMGIVLEAPRETVLERTIGRHVCQTCYSNVLPGEQCCPDRVVTSRDDDRYELLLKRYDSFLETFHLMESIFESRWPLHKINASRDQDHVTRDALKIFSYIG